jgi:hypothetical protein
MNCLFEGYDKIVLPIAISMIKQCHVKSYNMIKQCHMKSYNLDFRSTQKNEKNNPMTIYASSQFNLFLVHFCLYLIKSRIKHHSYHFYGVLCDVHIYILFLFLSIAQHESITRKNISWSVTVYNKKLSCQCNLTA